MLGPKMIEEAEATGRVAEVYARSRRRSNTSPIFLIRTSAFSEARRGSWRSPSGRARSSAESSASPFHRSVLNRRGAKDRE